MDQLYLQQASCTICGTSSPRSALGAVAYFPKWMKNWPGLQGRRSRSLLQKYSLRHVSNPFPRGFCARRSSTRGQLINRQKDTMWRVRALGRRSAFGRKDTPSHATAWMTLEDVMLHEISQSQTGKCCVVPGGTRVVGSTETERRTRLPGRGRGKPGPCV